MAELPKKRNLTFDDIMFYKKEFEDLIFICEAFPITMEQIVKAATLLGKIAFWGKLDLYTRILFDGAKD